MANLKLYSYWRSSASYRVRIALHLKDLAFETIPVHLLEGGGEQHQADYHDINPSELIPTLVDGKITLSQSLAIIQYLDDVYPQHPLIPTSSKEKHLALSLAYDIAMEVHPLANLRVVQHLASQGLGAKQKQDWIQHWIIMGFTALEEKLARLNHGQRFALGSQPTIVEAVLIPQVYNAQRFDVDLSAFPRIIEINQAAMQLPEFIAASPEKQVDAPIS